MIVVLNKQNPDLQSLRQKASSLLCRHTDQMCQQRLDEAHTLHYTVHCGKYSRIWSYKLSYELGIKLYFKAFLWTWVLYTEQYQQDHQMGYGILGDWSTTRIWDMSVDGTLHGEMPLWLLDDVINDFLINYESTLICC